MTLCAFLAPAVPRTLPTEHPEALPDALADVVADPLTYNNALRVLGEFSMLSLDPAALTVHRLVQAVVRARLDPTEERTWAERAVAVIRAAFPDDSWETSTWPRCELLLPQVLAVAEHAERLAVAGQEAGWLLDRASTYQRGARPVPPGAPARPARARRHRPRRSAPTTSTSPGGTTSWAACSGIWGT